MSFVPGVERYAQHRWGATLKGWKHEFSILDTFKPHSVDIDADRPIRSVFVTLGTISPYQFTALVDLLEEALPQEVQISWQLGVTQATPRRGTARDILTSREFERQVLGADLVITHAGVGTLIQLLEMGARVVAVPRRHRRGEHVDDHQLQIAAEFHDRGLVQTVELDELRAFLVAKRFAQ